MARDRRIAGRAPARQSDPLGSRLREPAVAGGGPRGRRQRPTSAVEPVRAGGQPAARDRAGGRAAPGDLARAVAPGSLLVHVFLRLHPPAGAPVGISLLFRLSTRHARRHGRRGRMGLLDLGGLLGRLERGAVDGDVSAPAPRTPPARAIPGPRFDRPDGRCSLAVVLRRPPRVVLSRCRRPGASTSCGSSVPRANGGERSAPRSGPARSPCCCRARSSSRSWKRSRARRNTGRAARPWPGAARASRCPSPKRRSACFPTSCRSRTASTAGAPSRHRATTAPGCRWATPAPRSFRWRWRGSAADGRPSGAARSSWPWRLRASPTARARRDSTI